MAFTQIIYTGNGQVPVDSGLPRVGEIFAVNPEGHLVWFTYSGRGEHDPRASRGWAPNSGNPIGNGWDQFKFICGGGNGTVYAVTPEGTLRWFGYKGHGESNLDGDKNWHLKTGNPIGKGWQDFTHLMSSPRAGLSTSGDAGAFFAVRSNGDLLWYRYLGNGEFDPGAATGWHANSGNVIGRGWNGFRLLTCASGVIFAIDAEGLLRWYFYHGRGEPDSSGSTGWHPNSGNPIGNGWQNMRHVFGGFNPDGERGIVLFAVNQDGDLLWFKYTGNGENDSSASTGWAANSGHTIGNGW